MLEEKGANAPYIRLLTEAEGGRTRIETYLIPYGDQAELRAKFKIVRGCKVES